MPGASAPIGWGDIVLAVRAFRHVGALQRQRFLRRVWLTEDGILGNDPPLRSSE